MDLLLTQLRVHQNLLDWSVKNIFLSRQRATWALLWNLLLKPRDGFGTLNKKEIRNVRLVKAGFWAFNRISIAQEQFMTLFLHLLKLYLLWDVRPRFFEAFDRPYLGWRFRSCLIAGRSDEPIRTACQGYRMETVVAVSLIFRGWRGR